MNKRVLVLSLLLFIALWPSAVLGAEEGTISGQLVNKTPGGHPVGGIEVSLVTYAGENPVSEKKATADASGKFEFGGLALGASNSYQVAVEFLGALYVSDNVFFDVKTPFQNIELSVYDSTESGEFIQASNAHFIVSAAQGDLSVMEVWRFTNNGDKTFVGSSEAGTIRFVLPEGATSPSVGDGFVMDPGTRILRDTMALLPGPNDIGISYVLPFDGSEMRLGRTLDYDLPKFRLLVQDTGVKVSSDGLVDAGSLDMGGTNYLYFTADNLAKGQEVSVSFSGLIKQQSTPPSESFPWAWLVAGLAALGLITTFAYPRIRRRQTPGVPAGQGAAAGSSNADVSVRLLNEMADLDESFEAGKLEESDYRLRRDLVKSRLAAEYARKKRGR